MKDEPTRLHRAERALLDSESRMQQVLDNTSAVMFAKDSLGRYMFANREFERVTGRPACDAVGRTDDELFAPELASQFRSNDQRVLREKRGIEFEESGDFGSGWRTFLSAKFPLLDTDGTVYAVCGILTDITDRKRFEEALSSAALAVSESEGDTLYRGLVRYVAAILQVDCAFIAIPDEEDPDQLQMLALHLDGATRENFSYPRAGTPCEVVMVHGFHCYPSRLEDHFEIGEEYKALAFESYAGHTLADRSGKPSD